MAVSIRLRRTGAKNNACFRIVAADRRAPRDGRFLEVLGWYDPKRKGDKCKLDLSRVEYWVSKGACLSNTVKNLVGNAKKLSIENSKNDSTSGVKLESPLEQDKSAAESKVDEEFVKSP